MSFSIDTGALFTMATQILNLLMPIVVLTGGISLGFVVVKKIAAAFKGGF